MYECPFAGWSNGELAVRFTEAYAQLAGSGRYTQVRKMGADSCAGVLWEMRSMPGAG